MAIKQKIKILILFSIVIISLLMHLEHFSKDLTSIHVWRQAQTQSTINNFYTESMNIFNPQRNDRGSGDGTFRMEFPIMQWIVAGLYKIFGNHLIISRIFMFITGLFTVFGIYKLLGAIFRNNFIALVGAWAFNFSPSFYYYTINPMPDNFALCSSVWGIAMFFIYLNNKRNLFLIYSGVLLSIGALCKLPFILYFAVPSIYFLTEILKKRDVINSIYRAIACCIFIILPIAWYITVIPDWEGNGIVQGMSQNETSIKVITEYLWFNFISTLPELLLNYGATPLFIAGFYFLIKNKSYKNPLFTVYLSWSIAILMYFLFEINMIAKIHDYYLFPFYPILFIIVGYGAYNLYKLKYRFFKYLTIFLLLILPFTAYLRMLNRWDTESPGFNKDLLLYKKELQNAVPDNALCIAGNDNSHFIFFYYIDKKGWGFDNDNLNSDNLKMMISQGASYLYSDSRNIDTNCLIRKEIDTLITQKGSIKVFRLKK